MNYYQLIADNFQSTIDTIALSADTLAGAIERGSQLMSDCLIGDHKIIACGNGVDAVLADDPAVALAAMKQHRIDQGG